MRAVSKSARLLTLVLAVCGNVGSLILPPPHNGPGAAPQATAVPGCSGSLLVKRPPDSNSQPITITALFPFPRSDLANSSDRDAALHANLHYFLPAAVIAMEEVNLALEGYHLQLDVRNTSCDRFTAINELIRSTEDARSSDSPHVAVLGPGCLDVTEAVSPLAHRLFLPQVSYANDINVPVLVAERRTDFPDLFQIVRNLFQTTKTALRVMDYFGWTEQVGFVYDNDHIYTSTVEQLARSSGRDFVLELSEGDVDIAINIPEGVFVELLEDARAELISEFMDSVRERTIRVIAGLVGEESACRMMCEAKEGIIPGEGFVWVFVGAYREKWWLNEAYCPCQLNDSDVESVILVSSQTKNTFSNDTLELGNNLAALKSEYIRRLNNWCPETNDTRPNPFFTTSYDALLTLGLAINSSLAILNASLEDYTPYGNATVKHYKASLYESIFNSLAKTNITGATGRLRFSSTGDRLGADVVQQIQGGVMTPVGLFSSEAGALEISEDELVWPGGGGVPGLFPVDEQKTATISILALTLVVTIGSNIFTLVIMGLVIRHRSHRIFVASGQRLNYIVFAGAFMAFSTIYLFVLFESPLGPRIPDGLFSSICIVRLYMIMMGFTLTFGTLFVRAWRIYRIFNNPFVAKRKYSDTYLMMMVGVLALVDIVLVTVYIIADRYGRSISRADADYDSFIACTYLGCASRDYFVAGTGILAMYKVLQMLLFLFVVSLVRRGVIERKIYDDSKFLAIALYVTAVFFLLGLPLQLLLSVSFRIAEALAVNMTWVNISTDVTLFAIFVPKLYQIIYKKVDVRKLMTQKSKFYLYSSDSRGTIL